ncbi:LysR substrate-binding domain-containing protein [Paraburkholderia sediminicola]|uniref:LysR substrate-binding domain-containing protein n=1 Tax=Paraburkholderia sediminicola TaxID=458836 RepID=UPI0038BB5FFE
MNQSKPKRKPAAYHRPRTVRIAAPHCFGETVVPKALALVRAAYPQRDMELVLNDRIVDLVTEGVDISFRLGQLGEGAFIARQLGQIARVLVAAPAYVDRHGPISEPSDLEKHPFIRVRGMFGAGQLPLRHLTSVVESVPIHAAVKTSHWRPMYEMIVTGAGIGVLEEPACADALLAGRLVRLLPGFDLPPFELNLLTQTQREVPTPVRLIVAMLLKCVPEMLRGVRAANHAHFDLYQESETKKWHAFRKSLSLTDNVCDVRSYPMAQQLIVAVFDSVDVAERAGRDFRNFEEKDLGFKIESGVLVQKDATGQLTVLDEQTRPFWGTVIGALTGGLIGMLGGPAGAVVGFTIGASGGLAGHAIKETLDNELVASITSKLTAGSVAFILEAQEASPFEVDNIVRGYGGSVFRKPLGR